MIIQSKKVWFADQFVAAQIEVEDGKITGVYPYGTKPVDKDYGNERILPGFIDVHCHGAYGFDTNDAEEEGLRYWARNIVQEGVTTFLPTTITQSEQVLTAALKNVAKVVADGYEGAEILGAHFEGALSGHGLQGCAAGAVYRQAYGGAIQKVSGSSERSHQVYHHGDRN